MFKIAVVGGPAEKYVILCLQSLRAQTITDWQARVVLDPVGDRTYEDARSVLDPRISVVLNKERRYALWNMCEAIDGMSPADDDVIVSIDADDWLNRADSLEVVKGAYDSDPKLLLTYGSWVSFPNPNANTNTKIPYTEDDFNGNIRKKPWRASHLKTFKYRLWKHINRKDFEDPRGGYFRVAWDLAFMWPMLEMAGYHRTKWIQEKIYVYNQQTPYNDAKKFLKDQMFFTNYIAAMPPYKYVECI